MHPSALLLAIALFGIPPSARAGDGVVVVKVDKDAAAAAGIQPGDELREWALVTTPPSRRHAIGSPLDVEEAEEQGVRGDVSIWGRRAGADMQWTLSPGTWNRSLCRNNWGLETRPTLSPELLDLFEDGRVLANAGRTDAAAGRFCLGAERARATSDPAAAAWLLLRAARALGPRKTSETAPLFSEAIRGLPPRLRANVLYERASGLLAANELANAESAYEGARAAFQETEPDGLGVARSTIGLAFVARAKGSLRDWERHLAASLALRERLAPGSLAVAESLHGLSLVNQVRSELDAAEGFSRRAIAIYERRLGAQSYPYLNAFQSLAYTLEARGDYSASEKAYLKILELAQTSPADNYRTMAVLSLSNLGVIAMKRGEYADSEDFHRRALELRKQIPGSEVGVGISKLNLAAPLRERGEASRAEALVREALAVFERVAPEAPFTSAAYQELGQERAALGDSAEAERLQRRAIAILRKESAGSLEESDGHEFLAELFLQGGDLSAADEEARRALEIRARKSPGSTVEVETLHTLGRTRWKMGDRGGAADLLCRATEGLENQRTKLGGTEGTRAAFAARFADVYRDYVELLIELGQADEAFHVLERSRARAFLSMLGEREIAFAADIPRELVEEQRRIAREYDRVMAKLAAEPEASREALMSRLRDLTRSAEDVAARIRALSPRLASLRSPAPLDVDGARSALGPGTTLLAYSVGKDRTLLFVLSGGAAPLRVVPIGVSRAELALRVDRLRKRIRLDRAAASISSSFEETSRQLFRDLIAPALGQLERGQRVLISPDGPLHRLPFAALEIEKDASSDTTRYLVEKMPLHTVLSATVYAQLTRERRAVRRPVELAALANPSYPRRSGHEPGALADSDLRSAMKNGFAFEPLPATEGEVRAIGSLYHDRSRLYIGSDASEENAKAIGADVRYLHFACHGVLDEDLPLNSALVLSIPDEDAGAARENGLLQAWEILNTMRLDADLVTLSACETALGAERGGEGIVGLTRAFQYAGARSVVASLWKVADDSTGELMKRFYSRLSAGEAKDQALRGAQVDLLRAGGLLANPFVWAGFQLDGDPR